MRILISTPTLHGNMSDIYYTCNGSPKGCERVRFTHCTFHDNLEKWAAMATNPNCDGGHCQSATGEFRTLPTGRDSNAILCRDCFAYEMQWRTDRNGELRYSNHFPIVTWESLAIYPEE